MTGLNKTLAGICSVAFVAVGVGILASSGLALPTKTPPLRLLFAGIALLLGSSPLSPGLICLALTGDRLQPRSRFTTLALGFGMALIGAAFLLAPKF